MEGMRSQFRFEGVVRQAIHHLKYRNVRALAAPLAELLAAYLRQRPLPGQVVVPVPLHGKRLRERGYNQSALLATGLAERVRLPVAGSHLVRLRQATPQARTASVRERRENVAGVFACRNTDLRDMEVLLVDDVATSGATLEACATALKAAGAAAVWGVTVAREV